MKKKEDVTPYDALKRIDELERENKRLKSRVKQLRFDLLTREEKLWVKNVFDMLNPDEERLPFDNKREDFVCKYIDYKDSQPCTIDDFFPKM